MRLFYIPLVMALMLLWLNLGSPALAEATATDGAAIFSIHCAGCHPNGGNIIRRGKNLKQRAMRRNGIESLDAIATLVKNGKNNMSAYKNQLSSQEIDAVALYVLKRAKQNWR